MSRSPTYPKRRFRDRRSLVRFGGSRPPPDLSLPKGIRGDPSVQSYGGGVSTSLRRGYGGPVRTNMSMKAELRAPSP